MEIFLSNWLRNRNTIEFLEIWEEKNYLYKIKTYEQ